MKSTRMTYLGLQIVGVVVGVLRVHWLLLQSLAHVAGILSTEAGNGDTGEEAGKLRAMGKRQRESCVIPVFAVSTNMLFSGPSKKGIGFVFWTATWRRSVSDEEAPELDQSPSIGQFLTQSLLDQ